MLEIMGKKYSRFFAEIVYLNLCTSVFFLILAAEKKDKKDEESMEA